MKTIKYKGLSDCDRGPCAWFEVGDVNVVSWLEPNGKVTIMYADEEGYYVDYWHDMPEAVGDAIFGKTLEVFASCDIELKA